MSKIMDCMTDSFKELGISLDEIMSNPKRKEEFEEAIKAIEESTDYLQASVVDPDVVLTSANDAVEKLRNVAKLAVFEEADQALKIRQLSTRVKSNASDIKTLSRNLEGIVTGAGDSAMHRKSATEKTLGNVFNSAIHSAEADVVKQTNAILKKLSAKMFNTRAHKEYYEKVYKAFYRLAYEDSIDDLFTGMEKAGVENIFKAWMKTNETIHAMKADAGLILGKVENYMGRRTMDAAKVRLIPKADFIAMMKEALSDETFSASILKNPKGKDEVLSKVYDGIVDPNSKSVELEDAFKAIVGSRKKSRQLFYKSGDAEYEVFRKTAPSTDFFTNVSKEINDSSSLIANWSTFGYDPVQAYENLIKEANQLYQSGKLGDITEKGYKSLESSVKKGEEVLALMIKSPTSDYSALGKTLIGLKYLQLTKLGSTAIATAPYDITTSITTVMADRGTTNGFAIGKEVVGNWMTVTGAYMNKENRAALAQALNVYQSAYSATLVSRMADDVISADQIGTGIEKVMQYGGAISKWSGLNVQTELSQMTSSLTSSHTLSKVVRGFKEGTLNKSMMETMQQSGLTRRELDFLSKNFDKLTGLDGIIDDEMFLNPQKIFDMDLKEFHGTSEALARRRRNDLYNKVTSFMDGRTAQSTPTPTLKSSTKRGKSSLSDKDALFEAMFTFKNTITKMTQDFQEQYMRMNRNMGTSQFAMAHLSFMGYSLGSYLAIDTISSAILDKKSAAERLRDGEYGMFMADYVTKTSPAPLVTDLPVRIFETSDRYGQSAVSDVATGPVFSMARDFENVFKSSDSSKAAGIFLRSHLLPTNLSWLRGGAGHFFDFDVRRWEKQKRGKGFAD